MLKKELTEHHLLIKKVFFFEKKHNFPSKNDYRYSRIVTYFYVFIY